MPAPDISAASRYFNRGTSVVVFATAVANKNSPTRVEINAGTDLSNEINEIDGWTVTGETIETPDLGTTFTSTISGSTSADDSSLTLYADVTGADARTLMPRGTNGFVLWMDGGDIAGRKMDVFPVRVTSVGKPRTTDDEAATVTIQYAITSEPAENVAIPA
ncbi:MAG: hypothetical protein ACRDT2_01985 [Natronosporangium sp.]